MKNKDRKAKLSSAYHEFSIHRRLFWLVSFLRFAIPCCDFPHDELSWRKSWDDDLNLEVIQRLYILTASFAPEHRINIQWNQSCQHDRRHLLFSRVSNEFQGISNRIVRMRDISLLCWREDLYSSPRLLNCSLAWRWSTRVLYVRYMPALQQPDDKRK